VALEVPGLDVGGTYIVEVRRSALNSFTGKPQNTGGLYETAGSVIGVTGTSPLPVLRFTEPGDYVIAMTNVQTGQVLYLKVVVA
jgi:hypothetical protein